MGLIKIALSIVLFGAVHCNALTCEYEEVKNTDGSVLARLWVTPSGSTNNWWDCTLNFNNPVTSGNFDGYTTHKRYAAFNGNSVSNLTPMSADKGDAFSNNQQNSKFKIEYLAKFSNGKKPVLQSAVFKGESCTVSGSSSSGGSSSGDSSSGGSGTTSAPPPSSPSTGTCPVTVDDICTKSDAKSFNVDYKKALKLSLQFYEAQRSGKLPPSTKAKIPWRDDSYTTDAVPGGYYDAGDNIKFMLPMANAITILGWGGDSFYEAYEDAGLVTEMKEALKWGTDWFEAAWTPNTQTLVVQIGDGDADHALWVRPEDHKPDYRPVFSVSPSSPGTEPAAEAAAALAASALFYEKAGDTALANQVIETAEEIFDFANNNKAVCHVHDPFYSSWSGYKDELCWAAGFLYKATGDSKYIDIAKSYYDSNFGGNKLFFNWDNKKIGCAILLYEITNDCTYKSALEGLATKIVNHATMGGGKLAWVDEWGSLRLANNLGHACMQIARLGIHQAECRQFAEDQLNFSLGDNSNNMSYMVGFGSNPPKNPHHRAASIDVTKGITGNYAMTRSGDNPNVLYGAVVGGPGYYNDYNDSREDYVKAEVACDYNAGFQSSLAAVVCKTN